MAATAVAALAGGGSALAGAVWWHMLLRSLTGVGVGGMVHTSQLLALDPIGPTWRAWAAVLLHCFFAAGGMLLALLCWLVTPAFTPRIIFRVIISLSLAPSLDHSSLSLLA